MNYRAHEPLSWWQLGPAVLPGLAMLAGDIWPASVSGIAWDRVQQATVLVLVLAGLTVSAFRRSLWRFPVWGLPALGIMMGLMMAMRPFFYWSVLETLPLGVLLALVGLFFAREHGIRAGLFVLSGRVYFLVWDLTHTRFLSLSTARELLTGPVAILLFGVLVPVLVMGLRSRLGHYLALLVPVAAYIVTFEVVIRQEGGYLLEPRDFPETLGLVVFFIILTLALVAYDRIGARFAKGNLATANRLR